MPLAWQGIIHLHVNKNKMVHFFKKLKTDKFDLNRYWTPGKSVVWTLLAALELTGTIKIRPSGQYVIKYHMSCLGSSCLPKRIILLKVSDKSQAGPPNPWWYGKGWTSACNKAVFHKAREWQLGLAFQVTDFQKIAQLLNKNPPLNFT